MKIKHYIVPILLTLLLICTKCANIVPVTGGPKDQKEPKLIKSVPHIGSTNFKGGKIIFEFDEEIEVDKNPVNIIISPIIEEEVILKVKNKKYLEVTVPKNLKENTTYSISINNAVKDITEANILKNVNYAFSTGNTLDSLSISGKTVNAENKSIIKNALVGLYTLSDTLDITKHKPFYITYSNNEGLFKLNYLKENTYCLLSINDKNKNLSFNNGEQAAIIENIKIESIITDPILLELNTNDSTGNKLLSRKIKENIQTLTYKNGIKNYSYLTTEKNDEIIITHNKNKPKEFTVHPINYQSDSIPYIVDSYDSLGNKRSDTITLYLKEKKNVNNTGKLTIESQDLLPGVKNIVFTSNKPISKINLDSIESNSNFDLYKNKDSIKITLLDNTIKDTIKVAFKKGSIITYDGDTLNKSTFMIVKADLSNYSILEMKIKTEYDNYLIQLLSEDYSILEEYKNITNLKYNYIKPGKYRIRAIIDSNNNNYWDPGNILKKEKPEKIIYFKNESINLKPNWEIKDLMFIF